MQSIEFLQYDLNYLLLNQEPRSPLIVVCESGAQVLRRRRDQGEQDRSQLPSEGLCIAPLRTRFFKLGLDLCSYQATFGFPVRFGKGRRALLDNRAGVPCGAMIIAIPVL